MPWSAWQTSPPKYLPVWGRFVTTASTSTGDAVGRLGSGSATALTAVAPEGEPVVRQHIQFLPAPANLDPMFPLVETPPGFYEIAGDWGTGWLDRPNYIDGDPSTMVEYEPGEATLAGWEWTGRPRVFIRGGPDMPATIEYIVPSAYFDGDGTAEYDMADHPTYPLPNGSVVANVPGTATGGTFVSPDPLPPLGPVPGFAVTIDAFPASPPIAGDEPNVQVTLGQLYTLVTYPRWRYWMPGGAPLRLIQRGDGLGMGSGRLFGTGTRQSSTRVLGAL